MHELILIKLMWTHIIVTTVHYLHISHKVFALLILFCTIPVCTTIHTPQVITLCTHNCILKCVLYAFPYIYIGKKIIGL